MILLGLEPPDGIAYTAPPFLAHVMGPKESIVWLTYGMASLHRPLVAQLDRAPGFEPGCREFESLRAGQTTL
jgi:hypothetical protein